MKRILVGIFFSVLLFVVGCHEKKVENIQYISIQPQEVKPIKKALIEGFNLYDSALVKYNRYAGDQDPKEFYSYISELKIEGTYFDRIVEGYSIKRFYCESLSHSFCLIRDTANNYFYFSNSDAYRYLKLFGDTLCRRGYGVRLRNSDTLFVYEDTISSEMTYMRNITQKMKFDPEKLYITRYLIENILYNLYEETFMVRLFSTQCRVLKLSHVKLNQLYKKREGVDTNNLYKIENELRLLSSSSISCTSEIYIENFGVVIIYYYQKGNSIGLKKYFVPQLEMPFFYSL
jgi:hypothetical protein